MKIRYGACFFMFFLHIVAIISFFLIYKIKTNTILLQILWYVIGMFGITAGYHRYWCHGTFKAVRFLQYILLCMGSSASQGSVIYWCKTHRTHHRNEDNVGDPYNISKGFWFAHFGWLITEPDRITNFEINKTNIDDLEDPLLKIQDRYYFIFWIVFSILIPVYITSLWKDTYNGLLSSFIRIALVLNGTWLVNSLAHYSGNKPFNKELAAKENGFVSFVSLGEGWHNYHHSFPKDYRASQYNKYNPTTVFIDIMSYFGLVYNRHIRDRDVKLYNWNKFDKNNYKVI